MAPPSDLDLRWKLSLPRMINLTTRSAQKELLDANEIPFADIRQNMKELNVVNTRLGGHAITISAIKILLTENKKNNICICEIGCGGGDNLAAIASWCNRNDIQAQFIGIDIKKECIAFAKEQYPRLPSTWIVSDFKTVVFTEKPDIIFSSLFCHHFTDEEIVPMLAWMHKNAQIGFFINDLHRNHWAYYSIKALTSLFSRSYLVKHDAPLSVARGFRKIEWNTLLQRAGLRQSIIKWKWAFRYLIICKK